MDEMEKMSIFEHLEELRYRIFVSVLVIAAFGLTAFFLVDFLREIILKPAHGMPLVFLSPPEAFLANIRLAFSAGLIISVPFLLYQVMAFLLPAFYKEERKVLIPAFIAIGLLFYGGLTFAYFVVFPLAINFFLGFAGEFLSPMFSFQNYLSFFTRFHLAFCLVFQVPLILFILGLLRIVSYDTLKQIRKFALLGVIIISALITPPDFFSQLLMIGPLYLLFEMGILLVRFVEKRRGE